MHVGLDLAGCGFAVVVTQAKPGQGMQWVRKYSAALLYLHTVKYIFNIDIHEGTDSHKFNLPFSILLHEIHIYYFYKLSTHMILTKSFKNHKF